MKLSEVLKVGDKVTVYKDRGSNWRLVVLEINDEQEQARLDLKAVKPQCGNGWWDIKISARGIPYAEW